MRGKRTRFDSVIAGENPKRRLLFALSAQVACGKFFLTLEFMFYSSVIYRTCFAVSVGGVDVDARNYKNPKLRQLQNNFNGAGGSLAQTNILGFNREASSITTEEMYVLKPLCLLSYFP